MNSTARCVNIIISRGVKTVASSAKSKEIARKRLNKENKSLFGKLLETQKDRRKILASDPVIDGNIKNLNQHESIDPNRATAFSEERFMKALSDSENLMKSPLTKSIQTQELVPSLGPTTNVIKNYFGVDSIYSKSGGGTKLRSADSANKNDKLKIQEIKTESEKLVAKKVPSGSVKSAASLLPDSKKQEIQIESEKPVTKKVPSGSVKPTTPLLPDSVIHNITSFPMLNLNKIEPIESSTNINNEVLWKYPSVSKVLNATMSEGSRAALARWRSKLIEQLGEEGFNKYYRGMYIRLCVINRKSYCF